MISCELPETPAHSDHDDRLRSVPELIENARTADSTGLLRRSLSSVGAASTAELLARLPNCGEPIVAWAINLALDKHDVPPCLRTPPGGDAPQVAFLTWLADVYWFCKRNPGHRPFYSRWRGLFANPAGSERWHRTALWIYRASKRKAVGYFHARGLALPDDQRQQLLTMPTNRMRADRLLLSRLPEFSEKLLADALSHRDRSGRQAPGVIAARRVEMLRTFLLAGRSPTRAIAYYQSTTGTAVSRQAFTRQVEAIERATRLRLLRS